MNRDRITPADFAAREGVGEWRVLVEGAHAEFLSPSFTAAAAFVGGIAEVADALDHHPDVSLRHPGRVRVMTTTHDRGGLTEWDVEFARRVSALAREHGAVAQTVSAELTAIAIDTMDATRVLPFWRAAFAYREANGLLVDPARIGPVIWFQAMDAPRAGRNRVHLDVYVPVDQAEQRVAAVIDAGGTLVTDRFAPSWWVLADHDGNEVCICTSTEPPPSARRT